MPTTQTCKTVPDGLPLAVVLPLVVGALPSALLSGVARARLLSYAEYLPPFQQIGGLEFRLHDDDQVDVGCFAQQTYAAEMVTWLTRFLAQQPALSKQAAWWSLLSFLQEWGLPNTPTSVISYTVLEADVLPDAVHGPVPMMFFYLDTVGATNTARDAVQTAMARMSNGAHATKCMGFLSPCLAAMQADDVWRGVGIMTGRDTADGVRLLLKLKPNRVLPYLRAVGWSGELDDIARLVRLLCADAPDASVLVYLDVGESIGPKLGIGRSVVDAAFENGKVESTFSFKTYKLRLQSLLDGLVHHNWCDPIKAQALMHMSKQLIHLGNTSQPWPTALLQQAQYRFPPAVSQFSHSVLSFKLVHDARTGASIAKAYTGFRHHWHTSELGIGGYHQIS